MSSAVRKQAPRLARPAARYWRGKAPKGVADVDSDSDSEEEGIAEDEVREEDEDMPLGAIEGDGDEEDDEDLSHKAAAKDKQGKTMNISLRDVNIKEGKVIVAGREESGRTLMEESEEESEEDEDGGEVKPVKADAGSEESSEYESDSDSEEPPKPMFRPVFVPKRGRVTVLEREKEAEDSEEMLEMKRQQEEERRKQSHDMVAESIRRELAEKEKEKETPDIDDTDGLDADAEFEAWRLRELSRIKRDKEEQLARELEREEIERRRALPEEQRLKEDLEHAKKTRESKPKGQQKFLQKYWHKGAFHQDDEVLKKHDYTEATESTMDVTLLPQVMQVRDFGKRSRTKYTHLVNEDTTAGNGGFGGSQFLGKPGGKPGDMSSGCFICGGAHLKKDCPKNTGPPGSGANTYNGSESRTWGDKDRDSERAWRSRDRERGDLDGGSYGDRRESDYRDRRRNSKDRVGRRDRNDYPKRSGGRQYGDRDGERRGRHSPSGSPPRRRDFRDEGRRRSRERFVEDDRRKRKRTD